MNKKVKFPVLALAAAVLAGTLSACAPLILGGAAVGAIVTFDRRTSGAQLEDEGIELRGASRLRDALGDRAHVNITSYNRQVLLTGEVPNEQGRQTAAQVVSRVENVKGIINELAVMPNTTLSQRSSDTLITGKVKASLVDDRRLYVGAFKVVTERGVVYLMGRVTQAEADRATQIARNVDGVRRVVRSFEIISEEELRQLVPQLGGSAPAPARAPAPVSPAPAPAPAAPDAAPAVTQPAAPRSAEPTPLPPAR
ncbi:MAG: BON domain-containing protein [Ramlibacter sp.]|nr:BON domain-containing protein [Ramlibacter sp.]